MNVEALSSRRRVNEAYLRILKSIGNDILYPGEIANRLGISLQLLFNYLDWLGHVGYISFSSDGFGIVYFLSEKGSKSVKEYNKEEKRLAHRTRLAEH